MEAQRLLWKDQWRGKPGSYLSMITFFCHFVSSCSLGLSLGSVLGPQPSLWFICFALFWINSCSSMVCCFFETGYVTKSGLELASSWRWPWTVILLLVCLKWWIIGFYPDLFSTRNKIQDFVNAGKHSIVWATLVSAVVVLNLIVSSTVPLWCLKEYFLKRDHFYFLKRGRGERERVCVGILECVYSETRKRCWILWPWGTSGCESPNVVAGNQSLVLWRQYMFLTSEPSLQPKGMLS